MVMRNAFENLATDSKVEQVRLAIADLNAKLASEVKLEEVRGAVADLDAKLSTETTLEAVRAAVAGLDAKLATEAKVEAVRAGVAGLDAKLGTEVTLAGVRTSVTDLEAKVATETTLDAVRAGVAGLDTKLATEAKVEAVRTGIAGLDAKLATEAKMEAVRAAVAGLDAKLATQATLEAVRVQIADLNAKTGDLLTDFAAGRIRSAGGKVSMSTGTTGSLTLRNPSGSGKVFTLQEFYLACDGNADVTFRFDATFATSTNVAAFMPHRAYEGTGMPTAAITTTSTSNPSGGTPLSVVYRLGANQPFMQQFVVVLLPGMSISVSVTAPGLSSATLYAAATWAEDPQ
jgi:hypothetical protein